MQRTRKDYIVLNGVDATMVGDVAQWNLGPHYFRNWMHNDRLVVSLVSCGFVAQTVADSASVMARVICNINSGNITSTSNTSLLGVVEAIGDTVGGQNYLSGGEVQGKIGLECERFHFISCLIQIGNTVLDVSTDSSSLLFVLEVEYYQQ